MALSIRRVMRVKNPDMAKAPSLKVPPKPLALRPVFNRILVKMPPVPEAPTMLEGIHLPPGAENTFAPQSPFVIAEVLSCGPNCTFLVPGNRILINRGAVEGMVIDEVTYWIATEDRVISIVDKSA